MKRKKGDKYSKPGGYLFDKLPVNPVKDTSKSRALITPGLPRLGRLSFGKILAREAMTAEQLALATERSTSREVLCFCDTNFFSVAINFAVWDKLLTRRIVITPFVLDELQPWLATPNHNLPVRELVADALLKGNSKLEFLTISPDHEAHGFQHYFQLLCERKLAGERLYHEMESALGRPPTDTEFKQACQKHYGDRGGGIAYKGWTEHARSNRFGDEQMVTLAVLTGIMRGVDVVLFSRDTGVEEQFAKIVGFLNGDYPAMHLADRYAAKPDCLPFRRLEIPPGDENFAGDHILLCEIPKAQVEGYLPLGYRPLHLHVVTVSEGPKDLRVTSLSWSAEFGIKRLLQLKSSTGGLNTDRLGGRNLRLGSVANGSVVVPTILNEKMVPSGPVNLPSTDLKYATFTNEPVGPMVQIPGNW